MLFVQLLIKLLYFLAGVVKGAAAAGGNAVKPAPAATGYIGDRFQEAGAFETMEQRVEGTGTDPIAVVRELLHHRQAKDGLLCSMEQHVDAYESEEQFPPVILHSIHYTAT